MRQHWQRDATPKTVMEAQEGATLPTAGAKAAWEADWRKRYDARFGTLRGLPGWIPPGFKIKELAAFGGVHEMVPLLAHFRDQILMANGVPRSTLGDVVDANRAAAETNSYVFDRNTILPKVELIADALTWQLAKDFDPTLMVKFKKFVADDKEFLLKSERQDLEMKVRSINQVLEEDRDREPVTWGDLPVGTHADTPYDGTEPEPLPVPGAAGAPAATSEPRANQRAAKRRRKSKNRWRAQTTI
jgi:hypothetical protein